MKYPKAVMSITELIHMGFPKKDFERYVKEPDFPAHKTACGGKWLVHTDDLDDFIQDFGKREAFRRELLRGRRQRA